MNVQATKEILHDGVIAKATLGAMTDDELIRQRKITLDGIRLMSESLNTKQVKAEIYKQMQPILVQVNDELKFRRDPCLDFDGMKFPVDEAGEKFYHPETAIVRCVHESCCPVCGRDADDIVAEWVCGWIKNDPWHNRKGWTVECTIGHRASVEPTESGCDWGGWIDSR